MKFRERKLLSSMNKPVAMERVLRTKIKMNACKKRRAKEIVSKTVKKVMGLIQKVKKILLLQMAQFSQILVKVMMMVFGFYHQSINR